MLNIKFDKNKLFKEFEYYKRALGTLSYSNKNYIVKYFQQNIFYKVENKLYENSTIKDKIINNRCKYLNKTKDELTDSEILSGFKYSGIYWGYSHFNPLIFKYFIDEFGINTCYDPCGGWGHRLLGALNLSLYIYNDIDIDVANNCKKIIEYFNIKNCKIYNNDMRNFNPKEYYEAIFTCPPYYNLEKYNSNKFKSKNEYYDFINDLFNIFTNSNAYIFGLVIREDLLPEYYQNLYYKKYLINNKGNMYLIGKKYHKNNEYLYIFIKNEL